MCTQELLLNAMLGGLRTILSALQGVVGDVTITCGQCIARCEMVIDSCPKQQLLQVVGGDSEVAVLHLRVDTPFSVQPMVTEIHEPIAPRILSLGSRTTSASESAMRRSRITVVFFSKTGLEALSGSRAVFPEQSQELEQVCRPNDRVVIHVVGACPIVSKSAQE